MKQFYFFQVKRESNGNQMRKVCYPLPGQTTYLTCHDRNHVIDHAYRAQLDRAENSKAVRLPVDTIIGICHEGATVRECRLLEYENHGTTFYKATGEIFLVSDIHHDIVGLRGMSECDGMQRAYEQLLPVNVVRSESDSQRGMDTSAPASTGSAASPSQERTGTSGVTPASYTRVDMRELDAIEQSMLNTLSQRQVNEKLLMISQIRDRMRSGVARFVYVKQNGETRVAYGTRSSRVITSLVGAIESSSRRDGESENSGQHFYYFDIQRRGWRCFCTEDIQSVSVDYFLHESNESDIRTICGNA